MMTYGPIEEMYLPLLLCSALLGVARPFLPTNEKSTDNIP
jgi:hypothetical protein